MCTFGWDADHVRKGITGAQGWVYYTWAVEHEIRALGGRVDKERSSASYLRQEIEAIRKRNRCRTKAKSG